MSKKRKKLPVNKHKRLIKTRLIKTLGCFDSIKKIIFEESIKIIWTKLLNVLSGLILALFGIILFKALQIDIIVNIDIAIELMKHLNLNDLLFEFKRLADVYSFHLF